MTQKNPKNPVSHFYWNDWLNDSALKLCSFAAKGLWMDCLSLAALCKPYGYLAADDGRPLTADDLATSLPGRHSASEIAPLLQELVESGAAKTVKKTGVIFCRRMVRDAQKKAEGIKNGKKGGNPTLGNKRQKSEGVKPWDNPPLNPNTSSYSNNPKSLYENSDENFERWKLRVNAFYQRGTWFGEWGGKPGESDYQGPKTLIKNATTELEKRENDSNTASNQSS